jgi:predicted PurR-regulated permease PerM
MDYLQPANKRKLMESILGFLLLILLLYGTYTTLSAFFGIFSFAIIFGVALSKPFEKLCSMLGGKRSIAGFIMGVLILGVIALPMLLIVKVLGGYIHDAQQLVTDIRNNQVPPLPASLAEIPFVGPKITAFWSSMEKDPQATVGQYHDQIKSVLQHLLSAGGGFAGFVLQLIVGCIISVIFLTMGEKVLAPVKLIANRFFGEKVGQAMLNVTGRAINGVAIGLMGTALVEAAAAWIGYRIAGIEIAGGLAAITFLLAVVQLGPLPILIPVIIWMGGQGNNGMMIFLIIYGLVVLVGIDNVLKPYLIGKGGNLPVLVLFLGTIGGMAAWGFMGLFKGAIIISIMYTIYQIWSERVADQELPDENGYEKASSA